MAVILAIFAALKGLKPPICGKRASTLGERKLLNFKGQGDFLNKHFNIMKNDFAKSIMDSSYNKVEGIGEEIELFDVLLKYCYQHQHEQMSNYDAYAEDLGITREQALKYQDWINDGKLTGIESDEHSMNFRNVSMVKSLWNWMTCLDRKCVNEK